MRLTISCVICTSTQSVITVFVLGSCQCYLISGTDVSGKGCDFVYKNGLVLNISSMEVAFVPLLHNQICFHFIGKGYISRLQKINPNHYYSGILWYVYVVWGSNCTHMCNCVKLPFKHNFLLTAGVESSSSWACILSRTIHNKPFSISLSQFPQFQKLLLSGQRLSCVWISWLFLYTWLVLLIAELGCCAFHSKNML